MCKTLPYITEEFCNRHSVLFRPEVANHVLVPIALGMVLANKPKDYGSDEWRSRFDSYMLKIYLRDCDLYDRRDSGEWCVTRKKFYTEESYIKE